MENLVQRLADKLNASPLEPGEFLQARDEEKLFIEVKLFIEEHSSELNEEEGKSLNDLAILLHHRAHPNRPINVRDYQRFVPIVPGISFDKPVWQLVWDLSPLLTHPVQAAYFDDLMFEHIKELEILNEFSYPVIKKRVLERFFAKEDWLNSIPSDQRPKRWIMVMMDTISRKLELALFFKDRKTLERTLESLRFYSALFHGQKSWHELLAIMKSFLYVIESKALNDLVPEDERRKLVEWAREMAEGFSETYSWTHLISDSNEIAGRIELTMGVQDSIIKSRHCTAELIAKVAEKRALDGEYIAAAIFLDEAIARAREANDHELALSLSVNRSRMMQKAKTAGEFKEIENRYQSDTKQWAAFIEPFQQTKTPQEALELWIRHPGFILDYQGLEDELRQNAPLMAHIATTSILDSALGLQLASENEKVTGVDLHAKLRLIQIVKIHAAMFLEPSLAFIRKDKGVTAEHLIAEFESWPLFFENNLSIVKHGIMRHFEGDYMSAIHILTPQFEAVMRRAFYRAGFPGALDFPDSQGANQQERTFGSFLEQTRNQGIIPPVLYKHFSYIFTERLGLNLRNKIAHGIIEPGLLDGSISSLVLHSLMFLTLFRQKDGDS